MTFRITQPKKKTNNGIKLDPYTCANIEPKTIVKLHRKQSKLSYKPEVMILIRKTNKQNTVLMIDDTKQKSNYKEISQNLFSCIREMKVIFCFISFVNHQLTLIIAPMHICLLSNTICIT